VGKGGRCVRLTTLPPSCAVVMKSGSLNFLEPFGTVQAWNGTALPFIFYYGNMFQSLLGWPEDGLKKDRNMLPQ